MAGRAVEEPPRENQFSGAAGVLCKSRPEMAEVKDLLAWKPVPVDAAILERSWKLQDRYQLSFWDALIVAAAKSIGCRYLLTEDLQTNQDLDGIIVISPFLADPASLSRK
jgi:predicted nucleic acid-binding protein